MFVSDAQVRAALAAQLKVEPANLKDYWTSIIGRSHTAAYQDVQGRLLRRGFTQAQVDSWDRGAEMELDIALYWCLVRGGSVEAYDTQTLKALDRRAEIDTVQVFINGEWVRPLTGAAGPGTVNTGGPRDTGCGTVPSRPEDIKW